MEWRLVKNAPKHGEMIGWSKRHGFSLVYCDNLLLRDGGVEYFNGDTYCVVTHWTHLPEPPKATP